MRSIHKTHGRCRPCDIVWGWTGHPLVRNAWCSICGRALERTCVGLLAEREIRPLSQSQTASQQETIARYERERDEVVGTVLR